MRRWLAAATFLVLIGCIIFGGVMTVLKWDFMKLSTVQYKTRTHEIEEDFNAISINTDTADIVFVPSESDQCSIVSREPKNVIYWNSVKENTLLIETVDSRKWYEHIGIDFGTPQITVYLPKTEYTTLIIKERTGDIAIPEGFRFEDAALSLNTGNVEFSASAAGTVRIKTSTGRICVANGSVGTLDLSTSTGAVDVSNVLCAGDANIQVSTGKTNLNNMECRNLTSDGSTGNVNLDSVFAAERLSINRSTGDVKFNVCDAAEIFVQTSTGNVNGTFLSEKEFFVETDTGHADVPASIAGGRCEVKTSTGNIKLEIQ